MKKKSTLKRITTAVLLVALMATTAFAATTTKTDLMPAPEDTSNMLVSGTVVSVEIGEEFNTIEITNDNMGMIFHVNKTIFVIDQKTSKILSVNDIKKDMKITVVLDKMAPMTMSIPPQTSGAIGIVIQSDSGPVGLSDIRNIDIATNAAYVPLRVLAEAKGYEVKWQSHTKPILLSKDDIKIELLIGETNFVFTHMTKDIKPLDRMDELDLAVLLDNGTTMVPDTFIEAL